MSTAHDAEELRYVAHQGPNKKGMEKRNKLWATSNGPGMGYYNRKKSILGLDVNRKILCRASLQVTTPTQLLKKREFIPQFPIPSHLNSHVSQPNKTINSLIPLNSQSLLKTPCNQTVCCRNFPRPTRSRFFPGPRERETSWWARLKSTLELNRRKKYIECLSTCH